VAKTTISFEFFPPKTDAATAQLWDAMPKLAALGPKYMTVTYGAGGSTRDGTYSTLMRAKEFNIPLASHLTFINTKKSELYELTDKLWDDGIRHLVALRGDIPKGLAWPLDPDPDYFQYSSDFVEGLRARKDFEISVAAYPEKHPDSKTAQQDIDALKKKCDAGATRGITQFFFENDKFYEFVEKCRKAGVKIPIYPGVLPIHDFKSMTRFAERCQASVPSWLHEKFAGLEEKPEEARKIATELLTKQVQDLAANGVEHIHFYALNKAEITKDVCASLR
jgi:methylenetetrahydrofolate reductase (NADPH)